MGESTGVVEHKSPIIHTIESKQACQRRGSGNGLPGQKAQWAMGIQIEKDWQRKLAIFKLLDSTLNPIS